MQLKVDTSKCYKCCMVKAVHETVQLQIRLKTWTCFSGYIATAVLGTKGHVKLQLEVDSWNCYNGYIVRAVHGTR